MKKINKIISCLVVGIVILPINTMAMTKCETIYSNLDYNGNVEKTTINNEIRNISKGDVLDYTKLENIRNINGDEKFTLSNNTLTWKSTGKDIYYQGELNEALPIKVDVTYYLDNKQMKPKDMINKKGKVTIKIRFTNSDYNSSEGLYIPYVVNTTMILDNNDNNNFNITSGKSVSTGKNTILSAISSPGLYENTNISEFRDMDNITISYDTNKFSDLNIYFAITPKLIDEIDLSKLDQLDGIVSSLEQLQSGMNQLEDGSKKLAEGNKEIAEKTKMLTDGVGQLSDGMNTMNSNIQDINNKITGITDIANYINYILDSQTGSTIVITPEQYEMLPEEARATLQQLVGLYQANYQVLVSLKELDGYLSTTYQLYGLDRDAATITTELVGNNYSEQQIGLILASKNLYETKYQANEQMVNTIGASLNQLIHGDEGIIKTLVKYINTINGYSNQLADGSNKINYGLGEVYTNSVKLTDALYTVSDATNTLSNGISKINVEGINKLTSMGNNIYNYSNKAKRIVKLTNDYNGFSANNVNQTVFIYKLSTK